MESPQMEPQPELSFQVLGVESEGEDGETVIVMVDEWRIGGEIASEAAFVAERERQAQAQQDYMMRVARFLDERNAADAEQIAADDQAREERRAAANAELSKLGISTETIDVLTGGL